MQINGTTYKIKPDFRPATKLALNWIQLSNSNWVSTDRGVSQDTYDTEIRLYGRESDVNDLINDIEANRVSGSNVLTLTDFNSQEHIFGADLDYTVPITATAFMNMRAQKTWKGFEITLKLSCLSPSFTGGSGSLPILRFLDVGYDADAEYTIQKFDSYDRSFTYNDPESDIGLFAGTFTFDDSEMIQLRRYLATNRGATFSITNIFGVTYPFGRRSGSYPFDAKIIDFEDMGMISNFNVGKPRWHAKLTLAEVIPGLVIP